MTEYISLTKRIKDENGNDIVVCKYHGTEECRNIHKLNKCPLTCPIVGIMMESLNIFEEAILNDIGDNKND